MDFLKRTWADIDLDAVAYNMKQIRNAVAPDCMILGVVKADAYGHGDKYIAGEMDRAGVNWFGVSNIDEAISLRRCGIAKPILIFGSTPVSYASLLAKHHITQAVYSTVYAEALNEAAAAAGVTVNVHIKVDTGMSRIGFTATGDLDTATQRIAHACRLPYLHAQGIFTHFSSADDMAPDSRAYTRKQFDAFLQLIDLLHQNGIDFEIRHCCNSAATMAYPEMHLDMVRPGIICYGLSPSPDCRDMLPLRPVMHLYSCITMVKEIKAGTPISYNRIYTAPRDMKIATVSVGYADGYERALSNKGRMLVNGVYCQVVGRVCMDQLMLDVTDVPDPQPGDIVTIVGEDAGKTLTFDEMAQLCGTVNYENICLIGRRVPRIYKKHGTGIGVADYILGAMHG